METQDVLALVAVYTIIAASLSLSIYAKRTGSRLDSRKIIHVGVGFFIFVWWAFSEGWIMLAFFVVPFAILLFIAMFDGNRISSSDLGEISNGMGHRTGLLLYVLSIGILVAFFFENHWTAATIGIAAMTFGDAAGSIIGRRFGRHRIIGNKTAEGSLGVFMATSLAAGAVILIYGWLASCGLYGGSVDPSIPALICCMAAGAISSVVEMLCPGQLDNLANPLAVAASMALLGLRSWRGS